MNSSKARFLAALLLASQTLAGASVGMAHASERVGAPAAIEAEHGTACLIQHDPARCPVCQVIGVAALPEPYRAQFASAAHGERWARTAGYTPATRRFLPATAPRAPPFLLV